MPSDPARAAEAAHGALAAEAQRLCGHMETIAIALHDTAANLSQHEEPTAARYVAAAADRLHQLSGRLSGRDPAELATNAGRFAREQPRAFFATTVVAGFLLSRFMKAPAQPQPSSLDDATYRGAGTPYSPAGSIDDPDAYLSHGGI